MAQRSKADWTRARSHVPWVEREEWSRRLNDNPEALYRIIADSYDITLREGEARRGEQRSGRRPKPPQVPLEQVFKAIFPTQFSMDPFPTALEKLMDGRSQRQFSRKVPCHQTTLSRLLAGTLEPDMAMMERLARAGEAEPWYFLEWRAAWVGAVVTEALMADPNASVNAVKGLRTMMER